MKVLRSFLKGKYVFQACGQDVQRCSSELRTGKPFTHGGKKDDLDTDLHLVYLQEISTPVVGVIGKDASRGSLAQQNRKLVFLFLGINNLIVWRH